MYAETLMNFDEFKEMFNATLYDKVYYKYHKKNISPLKYKPSWCFPIFYFGTNENSYLLFLKEKNKSKGKGFTLFYP